MPYSLESLIGGAPAPTRVTPADVRAARGSGARPLVVLDDDPTGTQSVSDLPVLVSWSADDLEWALATGAGGVYVMTNSRSLSPADAEARNREVVRAALEAARRVGVDVDVVSRGDSTLRGHVPLEPDTVIDELAAAGVGVDGVLLVPAFGAAGRVTVDSVHHLRNADGDYSPVGESEFARDATFGYRSSDLAEWLEEKSGGRIAADSVVRLTLDTVRGSTEDLADLLADVTGWRYVVADAVEESDLSALALGLLAAEGRGRRFVCRVGPPFPRALLGHDVREPLTAAEVDDLRGSGRGSPSPQTGGLVVVGSHVALTTRQLDVLHARRSPATVELEVERVLGDDASQHLDEVVGATAAALADGDVVLGTSRDLVRGTDPDDSLRIARQVSDAVAAVVARLLERATPRFVVAKGGITSSDVAARGLGMRRAVVRGPMLPGLVSLWEPVDGPGRGVPYVVFAGNVGDDGSLAEVVAPLSTPSYRRGVRGWGPGPPRRRP
ncbi:four-carbon acid sugar kinase family protein [Nocardioides sp. CFH 31398]|uniref:four-carbon acid sugar kinase family protein n=1 Tax=Nocardioides sp. CFH 31398 TaxID=2919579 RepID=UPI001F05A194|nr:four-carbon acid sugar kinase family protein [Nocardioides sp. CFH 31398]MCH1866520.1 hypothetical protein [Nocardioides sp. CFH 31398]